MLGSSSSWPYQTWDKSGEIAISLCILNWCSCQTSYFDKTRVQCWYHAVTQKMNFLIEESSPVWMGSYIENGGGFWLRVWSWLLWWDSENFLIFLYKWVMDWWKAGLGPYHFFNLPVASCTLFCLLVCPSERPQMRSFRRLFLANYRKSFVTWHSSLQCYSKAVEILHVSLFSVLFFTWKSSLCLELYFLKALISNYENICCFWV